MSASAVKDISLLLFRQQEHKILFDMINVFGRKKLMHGMIIFLAVQDSSIGDLVTHSLSD